MPPILRPTRRARAGAAWAPLAVALIALATGAALIGVALAGPTPEDRAPRHMRAEQGLRSFESCAELAAYSRRHQEALGAFGGPVITDDALRADGAEGAEAAAPATGETGFSPTNVQEQGVDEPDLVKSDGTHIFAIAGGRVVATTRRRRSAGRRLAGPAARARCRHLHMGPRAAARGRAPAGDLQRRPATGTVDADGPDRGRCLRADRDACAADDGRRRRLRQRPAHGDDRARGHLDHPRPATGIDAGRQASRPHRGQRQALAAGALPRRSPARALLGPRDAQRADDRPRARPRPDRPRRRDDRRADRLRLAAVALRRHRALARPRRRRGTRIAGIDRDPSLRRQRPGRDRVRGDRHGAGLHAQPVVDVRARGAAPGRRDHGPAVGGGERRPRPRARASSACSASAPGAWSKSAGSATSVAASRSTPCASSARSATWSPSARSTRSTPSTSPTRRGPGARRAQDPRLLGLPAPGRPRPCSASARTRPPTARCSAPTSRSSTSRI